MNLTVGYFNKTQNIHGVKGETDGLVENGGGRGN